MTATTRSYDVAFARRQLETARELALTELDESRGRFLAFLIEMMLLASYRTEEGTGFRARGLDLDPRHLTALSEAARNPGKPLDEIKLRLVMAYVILEVCHRGPGVFERPEYERWIVAWFRRTGARPALPEIPEAFSRLTRPGRPKADAGVR